MPDSALASISVSAHLSMKMTPSVGLSKRAIHLIIVLFPAPLGPTIHVSPSSSAGDNLSGVHRIKIACSEDQQNRTDQNQWRQNGHRPPIRFQKPPISHVSRFLSPSALEAYFRIDTPAEKRLLIAVPVKTRILILFLLNLATKNTNISIPRTIASAAPKDAPLETPKVYGLAKGLRRRFCITQPLNLLWRLTARRGRGWRRYAAGSKLPRSNPCILAQWRVQGRSCSLRVRPPYSGIG